MTDEKYPAEVLDRDEDDGTMVESLENLTKEIVGHKIVGVERDVETENQYGWRSRATRLTLDDGRKVNLVYNDDCCAYTQVDEIITNLDNINHVITGVGTNDGFTKWHIYADLGDVMELKVGWSCGNPFYYAYGFDIVVEEA